jgi:hypothetical protein
MSRILILGIALILAGSVSSQVQAQSRGRPVELDPLRRYGPSSNQIRSSTSEPPRRPPVQARPAPRIVHDYYPGMRSGHGPNYNVPTLRHGSGARCVPGRGSFIGR